MSAPFPLSHAPIVHPSQPVATLCPNFLLFFFPLTRPPLGMVQCGVALCPLIGQRERLASVNDLKDEERSDFNGLHEDMHMRLAYVNGCIKICICD